MQSKKELLLSWLISTLKLHPLLPTYCRINIASLNNLHKGFHLHAALSLIPSFPILSTELVKDTHDGLNNYLRLKFIHEHMLNRHANTASKNTLHVKLPPTARSINLMAISKKEDEDSIIVLLEIALIVCLESEAKEVFVRAIMSMEMDNQIGIKSILEERGRSGRKLSGKILVGRGSKINVGNGIDNLSSDSEEEDRGKMVSHRSIHETNEVLQELKQMVESLEHENEQLRQSVSEQSQTEQTLREQLNQLQIDYTELQQQEFERLENQNSRDEFSTISRYEQQQYEEEIDELRKEMKENEEDYTREMSRIQGIVDKLEEEKSELKEKLFEAEYNSVIRADSEHKECVALALHRKIIAEYIEKSKAQKREEQEEFQLKLENVRLKNLVKELEGKLKRADHDRRRSSKLVDDKVGKFVADKLKMQLFIGVRDNLKEKLEEIKTHQKKMKEWMGKENMEV